MTFSSSVRLGLSSQPEQVDKKKKPGADNPEQDSQPSLLSAGSTSPDSATSFSAKTIFAAPAEADTEEPGTEEEAGTEDTGEAPGPDGTEGPDGAEEPDESDDDSEDSEDSGESGRGSLREELLGVGQIADNIVGGSDESDDAGDDGEDADDGTTDGTRTDDAGDVLVYEVGDEQGNPDQDGHSEAVTNVVENGTGENEGDINTEFIDFSETQQDQQDLAEQFENGELTEEEFLEATVDEYATGALDAASERLEGAVADGDDETRVVNISAGINRHLVYDNTAGLLAENPEFAAEVFGADFNTAGLSRTLEDGSPNPDFDPAAYQQVVDYVDNRIENEESSFDDSLERYQDATEQAADSGLTVVVAAGNDHQIYQELTDAGVQLDQGTDFNFLGMSEHVISVAASDDVTGEIADFSSRGTGADNPFGQFGPTVAINGVDEESVGDEFFVEDGGGPGGVDTGTSFSSPQVAALIHEMLEQNPDLTYDEIVEMLESGATDTAADANAEGAGIITDPESLVASADAPAGDEDGDASTPTAVATSTSGGGVWQLIQNMILSSPSTRPAVA